MDHAVDERVPDREALEAIADALDGGVILVDAEGEIVWMDRATRRRVNGDLNNLPLPLRREDGKAIDCLAAPVELTLHGQHVNMCVLQRTDVAKGGRPKEDAAKEGEGQDLIAAIEAIMADSASWFSRTIVEKLKAIRQPAGASNGSDHRRDLDLLSDRECEVLGLICEGKSGVAIGDILGLSDNTVRNHIASLYRKIGVNRRSAAIIWARERGITGRDSIAMGRTIRRRERAAGRRLLGD